MKNKVPKLRFKEFSDEWEEKKLGEIAKFSKGKNIAKIDISEEGFECIRYGELYTKYNEIIKEIISKTDLNKKDLIFSEIGDIIIPASGETAIDLATASCVLKSGIALGGDINIIKTKENGIFLSYYMNSSKKHEIASLAQGISVIHIYNSQLALLKLRLPSLQEQEKIANFLSSVDTKIEMLEKKKEILSDYKKGMMQKLFSQKLRFKDKNGNNYPEWEEKKLEEMCFLKNGLSLNQNLEKKGYPVTRIETISNKKINVNKIGYVETEKNIEDYKLQLGDILFSNINSITHIGKVAYVDKDYALYHGMNLLNIRFHKEYNSKFLYFMISNEKYKSYFEKICNQAVNQASINQTDLKKVKFIIPSLQEQEKIANFLSSIDKKIELVEGELEKNKEFKKGLLQQMFV